MYLGHVEVLLGGWRVVVSIEATGAAVSKAGPEIYKNLARRGVATGIASVPFCSDTDCFQGFRTHPI